MKSDYRQSLFITLFFLIVATITMCYHELWRDEYQAWLIASNSNSLSNLFQNSKYEGHPIAWFWLLYIGAKISPLPDFMRIIHLGIAAATVWLIVQYSYTKK